MNRVEPPVPATAVLGPIPRERPSDRLVVSPSTARNTALDFTKGALVVLMVAYHTLNYFRYDISLLRHLHFLPTSFIFIAGFLITHIYLPKILAGETGVYRRLLVRGLKTLALFAVLNVGVHAVFSSSYNRALGLDVLAANLDAVFLTGEQRASVFGVLLPISYLLMLSALLLRMAKALPLALPVVATGFCLGCAMLAWHGRLTFNLDLVSMGVLGMVAGFIPRAVLDRSARHGLVFVVAYLAYSVAIRYWYPTYLINTLGVALSLCLLYAVGRRIAASHFVARQLTLLGNYSLLSYLVQIAVLQALFRLSRIADRFEVGVLLPFILTVLITLLVVHAVARLRKHHGITDRAYQLVFA